MIPYSMKRWRWKTLVNLVKLIFDLPNFSLPMFYKSVKLISHYPFDLIQGSFKHGCGWYQYSKVF